jgi:hypothetical protein
MKSTAVLFGSFEYILNIKKLTLLLKMLIFFPGAPENMASQEMQSVLDFKTELVKVSFES